MGAVRVIMVMLVTVSVVMVMPVIMAVRVHRAICVNMRVFMPLAFDLRFACPAATNCTHRPVSSLILFEPGSNYSISISLTRISVPPVACT